MRRAQRYPVTQNYQDNKSTITLEQSRRGLCSQRSKHINIKYYLIKDKIEKGESGDTILP